MQIGIGIGVSRFGGRGVGIPPAVGPNLLLWSEQFQQVAAWTPTDLVVTADQATDPDGGGTADLLTPAVGGSIRQVSPTAPVEGREYVFSVYIKAAPGHAGNDTLVRAGTNLSLTHTTTTANSEWRRISKSFTALAGSTQLIVELLADLNDPIYAWGAKLEEGAVATAYVKREGT